MEWNWETARHRYAELFARAREQGATQETVAEAGAISGQNVISRLLANRGRGPTVDVFLRALRGINVDPADFFTKEGPHVPPPDGMTTLETRVSQLETQMRALARGETDVTPNGDSSISRQSVIVDVQIVDDAHAEITRRRLSHRAPSADGPVRETDRSGSGTHRAHSRGAREIA